MKLLHVSGKKSINVNVSDYRIDWDRACKSKFQFGVKQFFRQYWEGDNCVEELPVMGTKLSCDLINFTRNYAIEADGGFHNNFSVFHHKNRIGFLNSLKRDEKKNVWLESLGLCVIRIKEKEFKLLSYDWLKEKYEIDILGKYWED